VVGVSRTAQADDVRVDTVVEYRGQNGDTVHRPDPAAEEPQPACPEAYAHDQSSYRQVDYSLVASHRDLCKHPECFGSGIRWNGHICPNSLVDRPPRTQAFHVAILLAISDQTPIALRDVRDQLAIDSSDRSIRRGLKDAADAGWLERDGRRYLPGPLADDLGGEGQ